MLVLHEIVPCYRDVWRFFFEYFLLDRPFCSFNNRLMNGVFDVSKLSLGPIELLVCFLELFFFFFFFFDFFRDRFLLRSMSSSSGTYFISFGVFFLWKIKILID